MASHQGIRKADVGHDQGVAGQPVERLDVHACRLATETPESDGTAEWAATTIVIAEARAAGVTGLGYAYVDAAAAVVIRDLLAAAIVGIDAFAIPQAMSRMLHVVRNHGRAGIAASAISAVDVALWDLKARLLGLPLAQLLGPARTEVPVYASGGFTSTSLDALAREIEGYAAAGHQRVKIKIGRDPRIDLDRVRVARKAAGPEIELMVDANGAYPRKLAITQAEAMHREGVVYFEEPVSSDDLEGLRFVRDHASMSIAAREYAYDAMYFRHMLAAGAVDILQADATRCLGVTGFLAADALCDAFGLPLSSHCAPSLHVHLGTAARRFLHLEQFHDHVRVEGLLFDGAPHMHAGTVTWNPARPGLGLELRRTEVKRHAV
jgi:L-alanine-DL-glutamate epimerase-like enolase superfamily enzyme